MVRGLLILLLIAGAIAALTFFTVSQQGAACEACMVFEGRRACRSASAATRDEAEQHAIATACALVTSGVTADLACQRSLPASLQCE